MVAQSSTMTFYESFIIFGGVNLKAYCKSDFYTFSLGHKKKVETARSESTVSESGCMINEFLTSNHS